MKIHCSYRNNGEKWEKTGKKWDEEKNYKPEKGHLQIFSLPNSNLISKTNMK